MGTALLRGPGARSLLSWVLLLPAVPVPDSAVAAQVPDDITCNSRGCSGNGECSKHLGFTCFCNVNWYGTFCSVSQKECNSLTCAGNGACVPGDQDATTGPVEKCSCGCGWSGASCEICPQGESCNPFCPGVERLTEQELVDALRRREQEGRLSPAEQVYAVPPPTGSISGGAWAGIGVGVLVGCAVCIASLVYAVRRKREQDESVHKRRATAAYTVQHRREAGLQDENAGLERTEPPRCPTRASDDPSLRPANGTTPGAPPLGAGGRPRPRKRISPTAADGLDDLAYACASLPGMQPDFDRRSSGSGGAMDDSRGWPDRRSVGTGNGSGDPFNGRAQTGDSTTEGSRQRVAVVQLPPLEPGAGAAEGQPARARSQSQGSTRSWRSQGSSAPSQGSAGSRGARSAPARREGPRPRPAILPVAMTAASPAGGAFMDPRTPVNGDGRKTRARSASQKQRAQSRGGASAPLYSVNLS